VKRMHALGICARSRHLALHRLTASEGTQIETEQTEGSAQCAVHLQLRRTAKRMTPFRKCQIQVAARPVD
jgi:hypothetical protein